MIHSISAANYSPSFKAVDLSRSGKYSASPYANSYTPAVEKEKSHVGKTIANTVIVVVLAAAALLGVFRGNICKINPDAKGLKKIPHWLAKAGEFVNNKVYEPLANFCSGKGKKAVEKAEKAAEKSAEKA